MGRLIQGAPLRERRTIARRVLTLVNVLSLCDLNGMIRFPSFVRALNLENVNSAQRALVRWREWLPALGIRLESEYNPQLQELELHFDRRALARVVDEEQEEALELLLGERRETFRFAV